MNDIITVKNDIPIGNYELESLVQKNGSLLLTFLSDQYKVSINYGYQYIMYRGSDEGDRLRSINHYLEEKKEGYFKGKLMFMVTNSDFIEWVKNETYGMYENNEMHHYMFVTSEDIIEVVARGFPTITVDLYSC